jgi:hypothetical protein
MVINEKSVAETADSENQRQKQEQYKSVFDKGSSAPCPSTTSSLDGKTSTHSLVSLSSIYGTGSVAVLVTVILAGIPG